MGTNRISTVWTGSQDLGPLLREISSVDEDPKNVRLHPSENMEAIEASFRNFGQVKPLVVWRSTPDARPIVIAGNGSLRTMRKLEWTHFAATEFFGEEAKARSYAIVDNRAPELAIWDEAALSEQMSWIGERYTFEMAPAPEFEPLPVFFEPPAEPTRRPAAKVEPIRSSPPEPKDLEAAIARVNPGLVLKLRHWRQLHSDTKTSVFVELRRSAETNPDLEIPMTVVHSILELLT